MNSLPVLVHAWAHSLKLLRMIVVTEGRVACTAGRSQQQRQ
jgi:hypothetical protein